MLFDLLIVKMKPVNPLIHYFRLTKRRGKRALVELETLAAKGPAGLQMTKKMLSGKVVATSVQQKFMGPATSGQRV